ncbi:MAG: aminomethyl-transferring glycine dehydrogenase [Actinomycetales bacterium]|nr:aminomethyl-transferring glycine dehydrogenase [Actinomycetales bacterium]
MTELHSGLPLKTELAAEKFTERHIGPDETEIAHILKTLGYTSLTELTDAAVPENIALQTALALSDGKSEPEVLAELAQLAKMNTVLTPMIGLGYYGTHTPGVIARNIFENPAWYTAYTPYQPEISQGRLEALLNFQTMVTDLTGLDIASASLLDEATAAAEAMTLIRRMSNSESNTFLVDSDTHPQTLAVLNTRAEPLGIQLKLIDVNNYTSELADCFGLLVSYPASSGRINLLADLVAAAHDSGALVAAATDLLALTLITPPGEWGADIAVGSNQRFGVPIGFGGPHAGFMAVRSGLERSLPGRLVGVTKDAAGNVAYRLALQTREQHIRREKATSNICTAQVLLAVLASMYGVYHGPAGLKRIALKTHRLAVAFAEGLQNALAGATSPGRSPEESLSLAVPSNFFDTVQVTLPGKAREVVGAARKVNIAIYEVSPDKVSISFDETSTEQTVLDLWRAFTEVLSIETPDVVEINFDTQLSPHLARSSEFMTHEVFNSHHSETEMLRYIRRLSDKDLALDRSMIPLGSCTMKLNATTEMAAVTWPEFSAIHPFAPIDTVTGYLTMIRQLENWLAEITGYDSVNLQPNAGSQGEFAGLLAIRGYHLANGEANRQVCLIPSSAHGTNAASAVMAGMRVVVVACDERGDVDLADLKAKIDANAADLAALMITYPSTHGVYESTVSEICALIHDAGGQVYVDGANLNALVGLAKPGKFGADVSHLNLHKTFAIPHGGGGPGVGPVAVKSHLAPFLPSHPLRPEAGPLGQGFADGGVGPVSAAPWGSASILPISWAYIRLMGASGLKQASSVAVASANYIANQLEADFPVLYRGNRGLVAHECIIDLREITKETGITVDDVAKRLMDYGFHAPTMSFPVAGTLMIEPTESEALAELDRFVAAMKAIRQEIREVQSGTWPADDNPLVNAPHTADFVIGSWSDAYPRELGAYPTGSPVNKYWPTVRRIDGAFGDRNLVCSCPRPEAFAE